jgi:hypothetical protein
MIKVVPTTSLSISLFLYIYIYQRGFSHGVASCACLNGRPIEGAGLIADDLGYVPFLGHLTPSCPPVNWRALRCWQHTAAYSGLCDTAASTCAIPGKRNRLNSRVARYPYIEGQACDDKSMHTIFFWYRLNCIYAFLLFSTQHTTMRVTRRLPAVTYPRQRGLTM